MTADRHPLRYQAHKGSRAPYSHGEEPSLKSRKCRNCQRKLHVGMDIAALQLGVVGTRDFVPLETTFFCSEACLGAQLSLDSQAVEEERIP